MEESKHALREAAKARRDALAPQTRLGYSRSIQAKMVGLPQYLVADAVALYSPIGNEVETTLVLENALGQGKKVFFPKLRERGFSSFARVDSRADLVPGRYGILEPAGDLGLSDPDFRALVIVVPGLAFDYRGYRLGRGIGWYDQALSGIGDQGFFVGLAYEFQVVDRLPEEPWDQRVHCIITESRVIECSDRFQVKSMG